MFGRSDGSVTIDINGNESGFKKALSGAGKIAASAGKTIVASLTAVGAAVGTVSAGITAIGSKIVSEYADYEQLAGGVETLFGAQGKSLEEYAASVGKSVDEASAEYSKLLAAQETVMKNAENAYKTAGMSANDYMETVTSFSASLIQSLGGDTQKAAEYADMALTDMSDNANKMGSDMESLKNAYAGFAKQNYTMLDNLKLGYGGTKEEMQRLLADAEKLSGIKFDISSYADIVQAIHIIQENMDIAGTTAKEAEATISGSIGMLKASFENLLAGLGNADADIQGLIDRVVEAFNTVVKNISPVVDNIIAALPSAFAKISDAIGELLPGLLTTVTGSAAEIILTLADGIADNIDVIISAATMILETFVSTAQALIPTLQDVAVELVGGLCDFVTNNISDVVQLGLDMINAVCEGIAEALPLLIPAALNAVLQIVDTLADNIDMVVETAGKLLDGLAKGLTDKKNLDVLVEKVPEIVIKIADKLIEAIPEVLRFTGDFLQKIADELINFDWSETAEQVMNNVADALENAQRSVSVVLDNIFTGGAVYGGDTDNVSMSYDGFGSPDSIRENAEEVAGAIGEGQEWIADKYNKGKEIIDDAIGTGVYAVGAAGQSEYEKNRSTFSTVFPEMKNDIDTTTKTFSEANKKIAESNKKSTAELKKTNAQVSEEFKAFYENLDLARAMGDITDDEFIAQLDAKLNSSAEYKTSAYKSYWNKVTSAKEQAANKAAKAEEKAEKERQDRLDKQQKELEKKREQAAKERLEQQKKAASAELEQFKSDTDKITAEYSAKLSELQKERDSFKGKLSENIFSSETITDKNGNEKKIGGIADLKKKISARKELGKYLENLVKKGIPKGMLSELAAMDPTDGLEFAKQLDGMNDDKWKSLVADYNEYERVNEAVAKQVYAPQITALNEQYKSDMATLLDGVTEGAAAAGAQTVKEYLGGIDSASENALSDITEKLEDVTKEINDAISDGSLFKDVDTTAVGGNIAEGIAEGISSKSDLIKKSLEAALSSTDIMSFIASAVNFKSAGYTPASSSSVTNINNNVVNNNKYTTQGGGSSGGVTNLTVNLLWKDGTKLAEIVNTANNKIAIATGG